MNVTSHLGQLTELWCQIDFCERGFVLSQPTTPSCRYDFIVDVSGKLYRIQCKTAHKRENNRISISVVSKNWNSGKISNYLDEIDFFYTHWNGKGYLIPIELCKESNREKYIRLGEPNQYHYNSGRSIIYGSDYEIDKVIKKIDSSYSNNKIITIEDCDRSLARNKINIIK